MVCDFIDQYITRKIPYDDEELKDMVFLLQQRSHSSYCRKRGSFRFYFPKPPSPYTLIASKLHSDDDDSSLRTKKAKLILKQIHREVEKDCTRSLCSSLQNAGIPLKNYLDALQQCSQGTTIVLDKNLLNVQSIHISNESLASQYGHSMCY